MAITFVMQMEGVTQAQYDDVMDVLDLPSPKAARTGAWPAGLTSHSAGATPDGGWVVIDTWESEASAQAFYEGTLGPAMAKVGGIPEPRTTVFGVYNENVA